MQARNQDGVRLGCPLVEEKMRMFITVSEAYGDIVIPVKVWISAKNFYTNVCICLVINRCPGAFVWK